MTGVLLRLILLFLPLILYFVWRRQVRHRKEAAEAADVDDRAELDALQTRFVWIALALVASFVVVAAILATTSGEDPSKIYVPSHMEDGKLVPGEFK